MRIAILLTTLLVPSVALAIEPPSFLLIDTADGVVSVEQDYLPRVLSCELSGDKVPDEVLKANAVMARSWLYYQRYVVKKPLEANDYYIASSQSRQVYRCQEQVSNRAFESGDAGCKNPSDYSLRGNTLYGRDGQALLRLRHVNGRVRKTNAAGEVYYAFDWDPKWETPDGERANCLNPGDTSLWQACQCFRRKRYERAVSETRGQYLEYNQQIVLTMYRDGGRRTPRTGCSAKDRPDVCACWDETAKAGDVQYRRDLAGIAKGRASQLGLLCLAAYYQRDEDGRYGGAGYGAATTSSYIDCRNPKAQGCWNHTSLLSFYFGESGVAIKSLLPTASDVDLLDGLCSKMLETSTRSTKYSGLFYRTRQGTVFSCGRPTTNRRWRAHFVEQCSANPSAGAQRVPDTFFPMAISACDNPTRNCSQLATYHCPSGGKGESVGNGSAGETPAFGCRTADEDRGSPWGLALLVGLLLGFWRRRRAAA